MALPTLDHVLGTQTKVRLLRVLVALDTPVSGREAQRLAGVTSMSATGRALEDLTGVGILSRERTGATHLYRFNRQHVLAASLAALYRVEEEQPARLNRMLRRAIEEAGLFGIVESAALFGSTARGEASPGSDADVLVVVSEEEGVAAVQRALFGVYAAVQEQLGVRISPYVLAVAEVQRRSREHDPLMVAIESEGRTLWGKSLAELVQGW